MTPGDSARAKLPLASKVALLAPLAIALVSALLLGEGYRILLSAFAASEPPAWLIIACAHSLIALILICVLRPRSVLWPAVYTQAPNEAPKLRALCERAKILAYVPALGVAAVSIACFLASSYALWPFAAGGAQVPNFDATFFAFVLWIPIIEEILFRRGIGTWFRRRFGLWYGAYASALLFSLAHSFLSIKGLLQGDIPIVLGPFILGFCCEILYAVSGRLTPAICLHAACNASAFWFTWADPRLIEHMNWLYLN